MKSRFLAALMTTVIALSSSSAFAHWEVHRGADVKFDIPDGWTVSKEGDFLLTRSENGLTGIEFFAFDDGRGEAKSDEATLLKRIKQRFPDATKTRKVTKFKTKAGMLGARFMGKATRDQQLVIWFTVALVHKADPTKGIIAVGYVPKKELAKSKAKINQIMKSIQPAVDLR